MTAAAPPILHILAGPNGAGKTSLYEARIARLTDAEYVNADRLSFEALGRHATTQAEAELGQRLAEARRTALLGAGLSLVTESTFSHPSKLQLMRDARAAGYRVALYHLHLDTPELAVARVQAREAHGGHPVPEDRIRGRYARNPQLIREAALLADWAYVFDNSRLGLPPRRLISFVRGQPIGIIADLPAWALDLYGGDLPPRA
jgi:predicted ABC-type ATPase